MIIPVIAAVILVAVAFLLLETGTATVTSKYNFSQLKSLAVNAGFSDADSNTAAAIALAESGGDPKAYNPETLAGALPNQGSYGLWQIYLTAHPDAVGLNLYDPQINADEAFRVYEEAGNSFTPWSTYKNGAYVSRLPLGGTQA